MDYDVTNYKIILIRLCQLITATLYIILTLLIVSVPNIKIFLFEKDLSQSYLILSLLLLVIVILTIKPLMTITKNSIIILILSIIMTLFSVYVFHSIIYWYLNTLEGPISFRFFRLMMVASFETKLTTYTQVIANNIDIISKDNVQLKLFLQQSPILNNVIPSELMQFKLHDIPGYANTKLQYVLEEYKNLLIKASTTSSSTNFNIDYKILLGGAAALIIGALLLYYGKDTAIMALGRLGLKGQILSTNSYGASETLAKVGVTTAKDIQLLAQKVQDLAAIVSTVVSEHSNTLATLNELATKVHLMDGESRRLFTQIRNLLQISFKVYVPSITNTLGSMHKCLSSLSIEDKRYLTLNQ